MYYLLCSHFSLLLLLLLAGGGFSCDDSQDFFFTQNQKFIAVEFDFGSGIFAEENAVSRLDVQRCNGSVFQTLAAANGDHFALLWLFFGRVRDNDSTAYRFLFVNSLDQNSIVQR